MTVKDLYEYAKKYNAENYHIYIDGCFYGVYTDDIDLEQQLIKDFIIDRENKYFIIQ